MKFKFKYIFIFFILFSCIENTKLINKSNLQTKNVFNSKGFTLIYNNNYTKEKILKKKIDNRQFVILHSFLEQNSFVKVYNPINSKMVIAKVKYKTK